MPPVGSWLALPACYLLGGVPFSYLLGRLVGGVDLRRIGSGNLGATNVFRQLGPAWGILAFALDLGKGYVAVLLAQWAGGGAEGALASIMIVLSGLAAILGHSFTPYLGFRGGKGVATSAGVFLRLAPAATGLAFGAFILVMLIDRRVSVGSLLAALVLPLAVRFVDRGDGALFVFALLVALLVWLRHRANIGRILRGEEPRFSLSRQGGQR